MVLDIGKFRHRITIRKIASRTSGALGTVNTYTDILTTWAYVRPISVKRMLEYGQLHEDAEYEVTIRYNRELNITEAEYQVIYQGQTYIISSAINVDNMNKQQNFLISFNK